MIIKFLRFLRDLFQEKEPHYTRSFVHSRPAPDTLPPSNRPS